jgi:hypothetical protein
MGLYDEGMKSLWIEAANAKAFVRTRDHPPPHVHVVNRADRWEARVGFSFLTGRVQLMDVIPTVNSPTTATLNAVIRAVADHVDRFRDDWWEVYGDMDLTNRWIHVEDQETVALVTELKRRRRDATQIVSASYQPVERVLSLVTREGWRLKMAAGSGRME